MRISAAILTGGKASRLGGVVKGLLAGAGDVPLIQRLINELAIAGVQEVILSANDPQPYARFGRPVVADLHPGAGPLGGIEASLQDLAGRCESVLFLPCDLPNLTAVEMSALVRAHQSMPDRIVQAGTAENEHPLCAVIPVGVLPAVSSAIRAGHYGVGRLWRELAAVTVGFDDSPRLMNINTPADLHRWRQAVGGSDFCTRHAPRDAIPLAEREEYVERPKL
jgi:molybdopterin-guanine dinucleotide biosynthesis protein A